MFSSDELFEIFGIKIDANVGNIAIDSREITEGDLFIAIKGERVDGNDFVNAAFENGAHAAIISDPTKVASIYVDKIICVNDTISALKKLGRYARKRTGKTKIIGITGSVGKTTTKEMLAFLLSKQKKTFFSVKNYNSKIGLPICMSMIPQNAEIAIMEMGMSNFGDIENLIEISKPNISIITTIGESHLEFLKDKSGIAHAKSEIIKAGQEFCVLPSDSGYFNILKSKADTEKVKTITFGEEVGADLRLVNFESNGEKSAVSILADDGSKFSVALNSPKKSFAYSFLICLACVKTLGLDFKRLEEDIKEFFPVVGRGNMITLKDSSILIDDCYNAGPSSVKDSLASFKFLKQNNKVVILGDMGELGTDSPKYHEDLYDSILDSKANLVCLFGQNMYNLYKKLREVANVQWSETPDEIRTMLFRQEDTAYLVKASRFMHFEKVVEYIKLIYAE